MVLGNWGSEAVSEEIGLRNDAFDLYSPSCAQCYTGIIHTEWAPGRGHSFNENWHPIAYIKNVAPPRIF